MKRQRNLSTLANDVTETVVVDTDSVPTTSWFSDIVGISESEFRDLNDKPIVDMGDGYLELQNVVTKKRTKAGRFTLESIGDLMENIGDDESDEDWQYVPFEIISRDDYDDSSARYVDVAYQQSLPENRNAIFQVASNFNGVEAVSEIFSPDRTSFTEDYIWDRTQGPCASISAGGAAIVRVHAAFYDPKKPSAKWAQTSKRQCRFLEDLKDHFPTKNGYVIFNGSEPSKFPSKDDPEWDEMFKKVKIGYHRDIQVTTGHRTKAFERVHDSDQIIDQVFCAAINIAQSTSGKTNFHSPNSTAKCRFILEAAYSGTYLTAIHNHRKLLFLSLIGGGVFGNPKPWIYKAMINAHCKWARKNTTLQKVVLILYRESEMSPGFLKALVSNNIPFTYYKYKKGKKKLVAQHQPKCDEDTESLEDEEEKTKEVQTKKGEAEVKEIG